MTTNDINNIRELINTKFNEYDNIINLIQIKLNQLDTKINNIESHLMLFNKENKQEENIVELKKELLNISNEIIEKAIVFKDYRTVLALFKYYYKTKTNEINKYPIRIKSKRVYEYFNNNQWISDNNAHYIKHTLFMNIQTILYKYNNMDIVKDIDDIYNNQVFITKLSDEKYKRDIFKHIVDEIQS